MTDVAAPTEFRHDSLALAQPAATGNESPQRRSSLIVGSDGGAQPDLLSLRAKRDTLRRNNLLPFSRNTCTTPVLTCAMDTPIMMLLLTYDVVPSTSVSEMQDFRIALFRHFCLFFLRLNDKRT